jgi:4-amino-4-deoxy-L-arabinose transferase-like glycosyltransferase
LSFADGKYEWLLALAIVLALLAGRQHVHLCDGDAQLYRVVARNMVERADLFDLSYTRAVYPNFREHLPFGIWPIAAAIATLGEDALSGLDALWIVAVLVAVSLAARRLFESWWPAVGAVLVLGTTDSFVQYATFCRLDGPIALLGTASALPWLFGVPGWRRWGASTLAAAMACLVKGPFGLVLLCAAVASRVIFSRSWRALALGTLAAALALLPVVGFLAYQRALGDGTWWTGYVQAQLLSSAVGGRADDGILEPWYPLIAIWHQFWPGLALVPVAILRALKREDGSRKVLGLALLVGLLAMCLPARKLPHHVSLLYPLGALWTGEVLGAGFEWLSKRISMVRGGLASLALAAWLLVILGRPVWVRGGRCVLRSDIGEQLSLLAADSDLVLISDETQWRNVAALAAERRIVAWPVPDWAHAAELPVEAMHALVLEPHPEAPLAGFTLVRATPDWSLWTRFDPGLSAHPALARDASAASGSSGSGRAP